MNRNRIILLSLLLSLPVILFLLHHYFYLSNELQPTGFTVDENILYMSYARQYVDQENFSLYYSNPFNGNPESAKIYFQPINFLFAAAIKAGLDPGLTFSLFGLLMAIFCIYTGILIIQHLLAGQRNQTLISLLFTWGGGLTAIAGFAAVFFLSDQQPSSWLDSIHTADPANGWWGLNWGRNLFIPLEAYYHFLFLLNIYLVLKHKWKAAIAAAFFLSISHPFTGIEYLLIINGWILVEKLWFKNKEIPFFYWAGSIAVTFFHAWYYLFYLNSFPEHQQLFSQYSASWTYSLRIAIPAYLIVAILSVFAVRINKTTTILSQPHQRLFLCWAAIAFLLSKHEWFIRPIQPIHFTRGYIWAGLFLLSLPALLWLINESKKNQLKKWLFTGFIILFLADNILWTVNILRKKETTEWEGHITKDTKEVLEFLKDNSTVNDLLIGNAVLINYISHAYCPANSWVSHPYNTPNREDRIVQEKNFLRTGAMPADWKNRRVLLITDKESNDSIITKPDFFKERIFENNRYSIFIL